MKSKKTILTGWCFLLCGQRIHLTHESHSVFARVTYQTIKSLNFVLRSFGNTYPINSLGNIVRQQRPVRGVQAVKTGQPHWTFSKRPPLGVPPGTTAAQLPLYRNNSLNTAFAARPQVFEVRGKNNFETCFIRDSGHFYYDRKLLHYKLFSFHNEATADLD